jgi:hypothetical protein
LTFAEVRVEFSFTYPIDSGEDITVSVDTNDSEPMPVLRFPPSICGSDHMSKMLQAASLEADLIQARATEEWESKRREIAHERKSAGIAGDREAG